MNWNSYFDRIYVVNLPERTDRLQQAICEMNKYNIPFEVFEGFECDNRDGVNGIFLSIYKIIEKCYFNGIENVLIFEDDVLFVNNPQEYFKKIDWSLFKYGELYDIFYLGLNTDDRPLTNVNVISDFPKESNYRVVHAYGCHAMCISRKGMFKILKEITLQSFYFVDDFIEHPSQLRKCYSVQEPIDVFIAKKIQPDMKCFCSSTLLATQRNSYSDIEKKEVDQSYIVERFKKDTAHLR